MNTYNLVHYTEPIEREREREKNLDQKTKKREKNYHESKDREQEEKYTTNKICISTQKIEFKTRTKSTKLCI